MTRRTRRILFIICLILFLLVAPAVVFYSQGYRIDFQAKKISRTGALFLKVWPKSVQIYLNEKPIKKTDFFFGSVLIEDLLPKNYKVRVEKEGYHPWEKDLEIKEKEVVEFKNIFLIPKNPNFTILGKGINDFYFSPDGKKIILKEMAEKHWALKLYDLERNVKSHLIGESDISKIGVELFSLKFSPDSKKVLLEVGLKEQINPVRNMISNGVKYYNLEIEKTPSLLTEIEEPSPTLDTIPLSNILTYQTSGKEIYYLDQAGHLFKNKERLTEEPFSVKPETKYEILIFDKQVFLSENKNLYRFNPNLKSFEKFFEGINSLKISPDLKKIVYFSDFEIWILFLEEKFDQPQKKAGEKLFLTRFSEKIDQVFWYTSDYLIFNIGNKIKIAEIDERDRINIVDLPEFKNPEIFFNKTDKKLYLLSEGNLYSSETLLP